MSELELLAERLGRELQEMLAEFGVIASRRSYTRPSGSVEWRLIISGLRNVKAFAERVGFLRTKQAKLQTLISRAPQGPHRRSSDQVPFVANFVGQSNFFTGSVLCSGNDRTTTVHDEDGRVVFARPCALPADSKVVVAVKIGNTRVVKKSDAFLTGTVERALFEGRIVHLDVDVPGLGRYSVKLPATRRDQVAVGDEIGLNWSVRKASVFPYPEGGLERELRVD